MASACKRYCSVPQCNSYVSRDVSIHYFPHKNARLCKKWQQILKIGKPISRFMNVCSRHFLPSDFKPSEMVNPKCRRLKPHAIPSQNLPKTTHHREKSNGRKERNIVQLHVTTAENEINENGVTEVEPIQVFEPQIIRQEGKTFVDVGTQTDDLSQYTLQNVLNSDDKLKVFTGVNFNVFEAVCENVREILISNNKDVTNLALKVMITLIKLRLNIPFACLAIHFNLSNSTTTRYFYTMVSLVAQAVKPLIYWPSKHEVLSNIPKCFEKYKKTRVVLDCTEIGVDKCKCLNCRIATYSYYKGKCTMKFLIGITPSGLISFVSSSYGGRTSDKAIFNREHLIQKLSPGDAVMVDKGILIEKECEDNLVELIRPPFLRKKKQFSREEAEDTASIARARVHVERAIERIKNFKILNHQISWYMVPYLDDIVTIAAGLTNLTPPLLSDDKYT